MPPHVKKQILSFITPEIKSRIFTFSISNIEDFGENNSKIPNNMENPLAISESMSESEKSNAN